MTDANSPTGNKMSAPAKALYEAAYLAALAVGREVLREAFCGRESR